MAYKRNSSQKESASISQSPVGDLVRKMETSYISGTGVVISKYVRVDMYEDLNKIDAYLNSKHISGETDSLGREKPFFNIVTAAVNIWYRATVIKLNKIRLRAVKSKDTIDSFMANIHLHDWFRRERFGAFLSDWGRTLARYGSAVPKFVDQGDRLSCGITPWNRLLVDPVDMENNPQIEILELTEAQLYAKPGYDQEMVEKLCDALVARETVGKDKKDQNPNYVKLYEVHGNLPLSYLTGKTKDKDIYTNQMHVISFVATKEKGKFDDYTLYSGKEKQSPYFLTHLIKEDGQTLSIGAVQHLFDAQWMMNHTAKNIKDQLDLASKIIFQTADGNFVGMNAINAIETGDILVHQLNMPLTQLNNGSHDISSQQAYANQWKALSNEIVGISESMLGNTAPAGTAWRQVDALLQQNQSLFEVMRDNKSIAIEEMARRFIIPFIKRKMDTTKEIAATLEENDVTKIDTMYIKNQAISKVNAALVDAIINGETPTPEEQAAMMGIVAQNIQQSLQDQGGQRFFKPSQLDDRTWKEQFKDLEWELEVDSKDEAANDDAMTTLNTMFKTMVALQGRPMTPDERMVYNKILTLAGTVSPLELSGRSPQTPAPQVPQPPQTSAATPVAAGA